MVANVALCEAMVLTEKGTHSPDVDKMSETKKVDLLNTLKYFTKTKFEICSALIEKKRGNKNTSESVQFGRRRKLRTAKTDFGQ